MSTKGHESDERIEKLVTWARRNQRGLTIAGVAVVLVAGGFWFAASARARREAFAERELLQARSSGEAGNLPLATSDLQRVIERYGGTRAGQEAALTLAQFRLMQGQAELAAAELRGFVQSADRQFQDQAFAVLGTALEQAGQPGPAGQAYLDAAQRTRFDLVAAQMLVAAGRAFTAAGDTASAARAYQRILDDHAQTGAEVEARLRLAELRLGDIPS